MEKKYVWVLLLALVVIAIGVWPTTTVAQASRARVRSIDEMWEVARASPIDKYHEDTANQLTGRILGMPKDGRLEYLGTMAVDGLDIRFPSEGKKIDLEENGEFLVANLKYGANFFAVRRGATIDKVFGPLYMIDGYGIVDRVRDLGSSPGHSEMWLAQSLRAEKAEPDLVDSWNLRVYEMPTEVSWRTRDDGELRIGLSSPTQFNSVGSMEARYKVRLSKPHSLGVYFSPIGGHSSFFSANEHAEATVYGGGGPIVVWQLLRDGILSNPNIVLPTSSLGPQELFDMPRGKPASGIIGFVVGHDGQIISGYECTLFWGEQARTITCGEKGGVKFDRLDKTDFEISFSGFTEDPDAHSFLEGKSKLSLPH